MSDHMLWVERYRPKTVDDCILPESIKQTAKKFVQDGRLPNLMLSGAPGTGKTTLAKALCEELGYDYIMINGSQEGRLIDTLRDVVNKYASSVSFSGKRKIIIIDEADYITDLVQGALRNTIEEFSENCGFIFTCNFKGRIIQPLHSRCAVIDFVIPPSEKKKLAEDFIGRVVTILEENKVQYDKITVAKLIIKFFPDWRRILNELQRLSAGGKIDAELVALAQNNEVAGLVKMLQAKDFAGIRKWVFTQPTIDMAQLVRELDTALYTVVKPQCIPASIMVYADYQHKSITAIDPQINCLAMFVELMGNLEFK